MRTMESWEQLRCAAEKLGYEVREEYLGGVGGGVCQFGGKKWVFVDSGLTAMERARQLREALAGDPLFRSS